MNICLNAQLISDQAGYRAAGVSSYSRQLLYALGQAALHEAAQNGQTGHRFTAFVHTPGLRVPGVTLVASRLPLEQPAARIVWEQSVLPLELTRRRAQVVHGLVNVLPLATAVPGVVTVHDLSFVRTPDLLPPLKRLYLTRLCAAGVARAHKVIAVSRQTADDVLRCFGAPAAKVQVIYNGVSSAFTAGEEAANRQFRRAKGLPERYLLYLGTLEPRKNLELLLRAFAQWRRTASTGESGAGVAAVKLVLVGGQGWYYDTIFAQVEALGLAEAVLFPGFVAAEEVAAWYRAAEIFVYPSRLEGFGLPLLEAMACGTPVICSRTPSLLEVAGDAALTVESNDVDGLANTIRLLYGQPALRAELRRRGLAQAARFSWQRCAEATIQVYHQVCRQV